MRRLKNCLCHLRLLRIPDRFWAQRNRSSACTRMIITGAVQFYWMGRRSRSNVVLLNILRRSHIGAMALSGCCSQVQRSRCHSPRSRLAQMARRIVSQPKGWVFFTGKGKPRVSAVKVKWSLNRGGLTIPTTPVHFICARPVRLGILGIIQFTARTRHLLSLLTIWTTGRPDRAPAAAPALVPSAKPSRLRMQAEVPTPSPLLSAGPSRFNRPCPESNPI